MNQKIFISSLNKFESMQDEDLIDSIKKGDEDALNYIIEKYRNFVYVRTSRYFIIGAEKEDIVQEGMIGLFKAIKNYENDKQNSFRSFADLCIKRQLITAIKTSNRQKHMPLNSYLSLNKSAYENDDETSLMEVLNYNLVEDPLDTITNQETIQIMENRVQSVLSDFEKDVLDKYLKGYSYNQIADQLDAQVKSIDNAIQRIKKKVGRKIEDE